MEQNESVGLDKEQMLVDISGHFGVYLFNAIFFNWSYSACDCNRPDIMLRDKFLVEQFVRTVLYYLAGWKLQTFHRQRQLQKTIDRFTLASWRRIRLKATLRQRQACRLHLLQRGRKSNGERCSVMCYTVSLACRWLGLV